MRTIHTEQSSKDFYTARAGLKLLGKAIAVSGLQGRLDQLDGSSGRGIRHAEIVMTYLGLIAQGKSDFEAAENVRQDRFFRAALGIKKIPSNARLLQRMDESSLDYARALDVAVIDFFDCLAAPVGTLWTGHVPLDMDPWTHGKEATFWHMIQEGAVEEDRTPDFRRCERIRWPRPIIEHDADSRIKVWANQRRGEQRICLWFEQENYLVILADRGEYILPWTAYLVEQPHRQRKLQREYESYCRNKAQKG